MKPLAISALAVLLPAAVVSAQAAPQSASINQAPAAGSSCPVSMHALQGSGAGLVATRSAQPAHRPSGAIHLVLGSARAAKVASAKVAVSGYSAKPRVAQAAADRDTFTRTIDVAFRAEESGVAADLSLPGFTAVTSLRLESITYSDGTTWKVAGEQTCRIAPDPLMLVAGR